MCTVKILSINLCEKKKQNHRGKTSFGHQLCCCNLMLVLKDLFIFNVAAKIHFDDKWLHIVQGKDIPIVHRVIEVCITLVFFCSTF